MQKKFECIKGSSNMLYRCETADCRILFAVAHSRNEAYALAMDYLYADRIPCLSVQLEMERKNRLRFAGAPAGIYC